MKWLYVAFGLVGAVVPIIWIYVAHLSFAVAGALIDFGLLLFSLGLGLMFTPLGVVGGLFVAAAVHLIWYLNSRRSHYSG